MTRYRGRLLSGWAAGIVLALTAMGCGGGGGAGLGPAPANVAGTVVDGATGQPISGAHVRSGSRSTRTAPDGTFTVGADAGMVSLSISAAEYFTSSFTAETAAGQTADVGTLHLSSQNGSPPPAPF